METHTENLKKLIDIAIKHSLTSVSIETEKFEISFSKTNYQPSYKTTTNAKIEDVQKPKSLDIVSPYVGYYRGNANGVEQGTMVEPGTVVAFVEALGLSNEIIANERAIIEAWLVEPGTPVQYGTPIAKIRALHEN